MQSRSETPCIHVRPRERTRGRDVRAAVAHIAVHVIETLLPSETHLAS